MLGESPGARNGEEVETENVEQKHHHRPGVGLEVGVSDLRSHGAQIFMAECSGTVVS